MGYDAEIQKISAFIFFIKYNILLKNKKIKAEIFESRHRIPLLFNRSLLNRKLYTPSLYPP